MQKSSEWIYTQRFALTLCGSFCAEAVTCPLDVTKVRMQLYGEGAQRGSIQSRGAIKTAVDIAATDGVRGLFRGLSPALLRHSVYSPLRVTIYEQLRAYFAAQSPSGRSPPHMTAIAGAVAGMVGQAVASPADLLKIRMQADGRSRTQRYSGIRDAVQKIASQEGILSFWRGIGPNVVRAGLVNMGELASYDSAKQAVLRTGFVDDNVYAHTLSSIVSGLVSSILCTPADVIKTRIMNQPLHSKLYSGAIDCVIKTVRFEGARALFKGFFPIWARLGPWQFVFWVTYEKLRKIIGMTSF